LSEPGFPDLRAFLDQLRRDGDLRVVDAEVDPRLEAAEIHLARCLAEEGGADGIRVNTVNPDAVLRDSSIWDTGWREKRARTYGIEPAELDAFYRDRTTLKVSVEPEDVAEAVFFLVSDRAAKSTGNILNVDGGVAAAYTR